jgi:hypothetical protein
LYTLAKCATHQTARKIIKAKKKAVAIANSSIQRKCLEAPSSAKPIVERKNEFNLNKWRIIGNTIAQSSDV